MSTKNRGAILFIVIGLLSVLSWSIFTGSFILKNYYNKAFARKREKNLETMKRLSNNVHKIYIKNLEKKGVVNISDYLLKKGEKEIWEENFRENFPLTDSGFYIEEIYIKKSNNTSKKIYSKDSGVKNNYYGIIKNYSSVNSYNTIEIILKKDIKNFRIGDLKGYRIEILGKVEIKYCFRGNKYPFENVEKFQGDINVKIFEKRDNNSENK